MTKSVPIARQSSETLRGLPGYRIRKFAELWLDPVSLARVVDAPLADLHAEWSALREAGCAWRARWAAARGGAALCIGLASFAVAALVAPLPRWVAIAFGGVTCTLALFLALSNALQSRRVEVGQRVPTIPVDLWVRRPKAIEPATIEREPRPLPPRRQQSRVRGIGPILIAEPPPNFGEGATGLGPTFQPLISAPPPLTQSQEAEAIPMVRIPPDYPQDAITRGIEGFVLVRLWIGARGEVSKAEVAQARPRGVFERNALAAVRRWKYRPGQVDGEAVERGPFEVVLNFNLDDASR